MLRVFSLSLVFACILTAPDAMAQPLETQEYTVLETLGELEIRHYPPVMKIQSERGFNALFRYISGENQSGTEIKMTTPVYMGDSQGNEVMEFVLPKAFDEGNTPDPTSAAVRVVQSKEGHYVAIGFGGYASDAAATTYARRLKTLADRHQLKTVGEPMVLVYDSPYKFFNRKNEILLQIDYTPS